MRSEFIDPTEVDLICCWPIGNAEKLAKRGVVEHIRLVDGSIRFTDEQVEKLSRVVLPIPTGMKIGGAA